MKTFGRISLSILIGTALFFSGAYANSIYTKWFYPNRYYTVQEKEGENSLKDLNAGNVAGDSAGSTRADGYGTGEKAEAEDGGAAGTTSVGNGGQDTAQNFAGASGPGISAMPALSGDRECTSCDTKFVVMKYDMGLKTTVQEETEIPARYMGLTKEELQDEIALYVSAPPLSELNQGFVTAEIVSFSPQRVVVRKSYHKAQEAEGYVIIAEQNYVTVYRQDTENVYLYTDIRLDELPEEVQQEIIKRKYVETEEELYNFLESYSS